MSAAVEALQPGHETDALIAQSMGLEVTETEEECPSFAPGATWRGEYYAVTCYWETMPGREATCDDSLRPYSTDIAAAWVVMHWLRERGYGVILSDVRSGSWTCEIDRADWRGSEVWTADSAPLAICRAAYAAVKA